MEKEKWNNTMYDRFKESLYSMADEKYKDFHRKLVSEGLGEIIGVRSPDIKKTAKDIVKNTGSESFLKIAGYGTYRGNNGAGICYRLFQSGYNYKARIS